MSPYQYLNLVCDTVEKHGDRNNPYFEQARQIAQTHAQLTFQHAPHNVAEEAYRAIKKGVWCYARRIPSIRGNEDGFADAFCAYRDLVSKYRLLDLAFGERTALIVVDVQEDFVHGSLAVPNAMEVVPVISGIATAYSIRVITQDWHPADHCSFKKWPTHCVRNTLGASLVVDFGTYDAGANPGTKVIRIYKGYKPDVESYGAFQDDAGTDLGLAGALWNLGVSSVHICGLATDYCVKATALQAVAYGFNTTVLLNACRGVNNANHRPIAEMEGKGVQILK